MPALPKSTPVAVVGAGTMGAGIAQVAARAAHDVLLYDQDAAALARARTQIDADLDRLADKGRIASHDRGAIGARIRICETLDGLSGAGLVIEAIVEALEPKRALFAELEKRVESETILASNTSSLSITAIAAGLKHPERLAGMHFFNPAPVMRLVEIVRGIATSPATVDTLRATVEAWGKVPALAASTPGFIVNRVARGFYAEGLRALTEQAADAATIDAVMRECGGFRMGPFELIDLIGVDVNLAVTRSVFEAYYQDSRFRPSVVQQALVDAGRLGRKSGRGFYRHGDGVAPPKPRTAARAEPPGQVLVHGSLGPADAILSLLAQSPLKKGAGTRGAPSDSSHRRKPVSRVPETLDSGFRRNDEVSGDLNALEADGVLVTLTDG
ncbi:MAG: 3-hydroxyacyl-CoA dehydrogenase NAD-binding domain-containing protein, partial [Gammaproteobacteria bacterium]